MSTKQERMHAQIQAHGERLLRVWPRTTIQDPDRLCRTLMRVERAARQSATHWCNGDINESRYLRREQEHLARAQEILSDGANGRRYLSINSDPRGYALVVPARVMAAYDLDLPTNWGGGGVVCPTFDGAEVGQ